MDMTDSAEIDAAVAAIKRGANELTANDEMRKT